MRPWNEITANKRAVAYILFSVVVLASMFLMGIMPERKQKAEIEKEVLRLEAEIEQQEILRPIFRHLVKMQSHENSGGKETVISEMPVDLHFDIDTAPSVLFALANGPGMQKTRFSPSPESLSRDSNLLLIEGVLHGPYRDFRAFLIQLVTLPAFHSIELLDIRSTISDPEYRLKIWVKI